MPHCETILASLRGRGYRITPQREMIVQTITHSDGHMSAEEILTELQKRTQAINIATIYRTLETLWEEGFVYRNDLSEGKFAFTVSEHGPHVHLVCRKCRGVMDADPRVLLTLREALASQYSFEADLEHISLFGVCTQCHEEIG